jgi:hypothetical protein
MHHLHTPAVGVVILLQQTCETSAQGFVTSVQTGINNQADTALRGGGCSRFKEPEG